jgi:hypothetical protein
MLLGELSATPTFMDHLVFCFRGMGPIAITEITEKVRIPVMWLMATGLCLLINFDYANEDISHFGQQILIRSERRVHWWISKCVWNIFSCLLYFVLIWITLGIFSLMAGAVPSLTITPEVSAVSLSEVSTGSNIVITAYESALTVVLLPFLTTLALSLLEMFFSLFVKPAISFLICFSLLIISAYINSPIAIGNYAMIMRSDILIEAGVNATIGIIINTILILFVTVAGCHVFSRQNILNLEE